MKNYLKELGDDRFFVCSAATSGEETGNGVHYGTKRILTGLGISCESKVATRLIASDYDKYDYFVGMDEENKKNMRKIFGGDAKNKISLLMDYTNKPCSVADPWYTGDFTATYNDISLGIRKFYEYLIKKYGKIDL